MFSQGRSPGQKKGTVKLNQANADYVPDYNFVNQDINPYNVDGQSMFTNLQDLKVTGLQNSARRLPTKQDDGQQFETVVIEMKENLIVEQQRNERQEQDHVNPHSDDQRGQLIVQHTPDDSFHKLDFVGEINGDEENIYGAPLKPFYTKSYYDGFSSLSQIFFYHIFSFMLFIRKNVLDKGEKIRIEHLPQLINSEKIETVFKVAEQDVKKCTNDSQAKLTKWQLTKIIFFGVLTKKSILIVVWMLLEAISKCVTSILMSQLIQAIYDQNTKWAYIYGTIISAINILAVTGRHNSYYYALQFSIEARMILINLVFKKMTQLNAYSIKEANVGKIINLISGDLSLLEYHFVVVFQILILPVILIFGSAILWVRFDGPFGLLAIAILIVLYPIQLTYQQIASKYIMEAKTHGDQRMKLQNELIEGIRLIKMYAWEKAFEQFITTVRSKELACYTMTLVLYAFDRGLNFFCQIWGSLIFFIIAYYGNYSTLNSDKMISTIQLLSYMKQSCVFLVSFALSSLINISISFGRIIDLISLNSYEMKSIEEKGQNLIHPTPDPQVQPPLVELIDFSCYWTGNLTKDSVAVLKNMNLKIMQGELVAIIGRIGSGKSSFLNVLLMEIPLYSGTYNIQGKIASEGYHQIQVAYVEQEPFIFPDTIRRNILFGRPYHQQLYMLVIHVSNLLQDLNIMTNGDQTHIGERGINLSGGQRARLSLARALYQMADLYIFDDPLSAVDAKVARNIFNNAIKDFIFNIQPKLTGKPNLPSVVLATHQVQFALECDKIVVLEDGRIKAQGKYADVQNHLNMVSKDFNLIQTHGTTFKRNSIRPGTMKSIHISPTKLEKDREKAALYKREENSQQNVTLQTYKRYYSFWSPRMLGILIIIQSCASEVIYNLYLRYVSLFDENTTESEVSNAFMIMGVLCIVVYFNNMMKYIFNVLGVLGANKVLHNQMLTKLCLCPVSFFDTNPSGRILNRFSTDLSLADNEVVKMFWDIEELVIFFLFSLITIIILQPWFIFAVVPTILANLWILNLSKTMISQAKECDLIQRSPLFDLFKKTLSGVVQVRLYKQQDWFQRNFFELSNKCIQSNVAYYYFQRSFGFNIDFVGCLTSLFGIYLIIGLNGSNPASFVQALLLLLTFNDAQQWCLRQMISLDSSMNCFNRMFQIIDLESEAPHHQAIDSQMQKDWPPKGEVIFEKVYMRYREDTDLVLKNMNFHIYAGDKVGCVGRTGAGKSSILQAIFRMSELEVNSGSSVIIDGQNIEALGLEFLRSSIAIIPQIPFVFSGTIRRNLDPLQKCSDDQLWRVLDETHLKGTVEKMPSGLSTDMTDVSSVFSVGEKQLICLARTILSNKKIIVLDEATANVDMKTDEFIQNKIREKFADCTIITIAHRLNTIADYDKVMVIEAGRVLEFGTPLELLCRDVRSSTEIDATTQFATLVKQTGKENSAIIFGMARDHYIKSH